MDFSVIKLRKPKKKEMAFLGIIIIIIITLLHCGITFLRIELDVTHSNMS